MSKNKAKLKGSVLFTVVSVMMILVVFSIAALSTAAAANRRAHNRYADYQTRFTARSVVDVVLEAIDKNNELNSKIYNDLTNKGDSMDLDISGVDRSMGEIVSTDVTYLGKGDEYGYDPDEKLFKLSVTARMLGQENTIVAYYMAKITATPPTGNPTVNCSLISLGDGDLDNARAYGGMKYALEHTGPSGTAMYIGNDCDLYSPIEINNDVQFSALSFEKIKMTALGKGIYVNGNLTVNNGSPDACQRLFTNKGYGYKENPYIFVNGTLSLGGGNNQIGKSDNPIIVLADSLNQANSAQQLIYGDLYLYNGADLGNFCVNGWDNSGIIKKKHADGSYYTGGNIYSLGTLGYTYQGSIDLANNIISDTLNFVQDWNGSTYNTSGAVIAKKLNVTGQTNSSRNVLNFNGGIFVDPDNFNFSNSDNMSINHVKLKLTGEKEYTSNLLFDGMYNPTSGVVSSKNSITCQSGNETEWGGVAFNVAKQLKEIPEIDDKVKFYNGIYRYTLDTKTNMPVIKSEVVFGTDSKITVTLQKPAYIINDEVIVEPVLKYTNSEGNLQSLYLKEEATFTGNEINVVFDLSDKVIEVNPDSADIRMFIKVSPKYTVNNWSWHSLPKTPNCDSWAQSADQDKWSAYYKNYIEAFALNEYKNNPANKAAAEAATKKAYTTNPKHYTAEWIFPGDSWYPFPGGLWNPQNPRIYSKKENFDYNLKSEVLDNYLQVAWGHKWQENTWEFGWTPTVVDGKNHIDWINWYWDEVLTQEDRDNILIAAYIKNAENYWDTNAWFNDATPGIEQSQDRKKAVIEKNLDDMAKADFETNFNYWAEKYWEYLVGQQSTNIIAANAKIECNFQVKRSYYEFLLTAGNTLDWLRLANNRIFEMDDEKKIFIDDIDKSVLLQKNDTDHTITIYSANLKNIEGDEPTMALSLYKLVDVYDYTKDDKYKNFLQKVVELAAFPDSMKKENVQTKKAYGDEEDKFTPDGFVDNEFLMKDGINNKTKIVNEIEEKVNAAFNSEGAEEAKNNPIMTHECPAEITESCTLKSSSDIYITNISHDVTFKPVGDIYVILDNIRLNGHNFIVDDTDGKVHFLIPDGSTFEIEKGKVLNKYFNSSTAIEQNPTEKQKIPGIYFYSAGNGKISGINGCTISAYIFMPNGEFSVSATSAISFDGTYDGTPVNVSGSMIIGAVVCKKIELGNISMFAYVNENALGGAPTDPPTPPSTAVPSIDFLYYQTF